MTKTIPLYKQKNLSEYKALVDDDDFERVNAQMWFVRRISTHRCAVTFVEGETVPMERFLLGLSPDAGAVFFDHADGDWLNYTRDNLRFATRGQTIMYSHLRKHWETHEKPVLDLIEDQKVQSSEVWGRLVDSVRCVNCQFEIATIVKFKSGAVQVVVHSPFALKPLTEEKGGFVLECPRCAKSS